MPRPRAERAPAARPARVAVAADERRHLVQCCAFFRSQRHRPALPGEVREADLRAAREDIDTVIGRSPRGRRR